MKKVAKLVHFSFITRVIVDAKATDEDIVDLVKPKIVDKVENELSEHLEAIVEDAECPFGTLDTDDPTIDIVILNPQEKQYIVIGKGIPVQVRKFDDFSDWDSVNDLNGEPVFDVQIDDDDGCDEPYQFQYVDLKFIHGNYEVGENYIGVKPQVVTEPITYILARMLEKSLHK